VNTTPISKQMKQGVSSSVFSGGVLLITYQNKIVFQKAFGHAMIQPKYQTTDLHTFFDLASLTKPLVTATAIALLHQQKLVRLDDALVKFLPEFSGGLKNQVTLFHLLNHCSGLPAWQPYYEEIRVREKQEPGFLGSASAKKAVFKLAHGEHLLSKPGEKSTYSDIGFILLGEVVEKISGMSLDTFFTHHITSPLKASESFFPGLRENSLDTAFAATEASGWRNGPVAGTVHDDNAYVMGGISGHAGLFATASGVNQLVRAWIDALDDKGLLHPDIAEHFVSRQSSTQNPAGTSWGLGWDTPSVARHTGSPGVSSSGHYFSSESFGHLGFTGTSIWVDRTHKLVVVFLSNRVHPGRNNEAIRTFRPKLHDIIFETFIHG